MRFKFPPEFLAKHGAQLEAFDWSSRSEGDYARLSEVVGQPQLEGITLIVERDAAGLQVRCLRPTDMLRLRRYNDTLPQLPKPSAEEVAAALAGRNPSAEQRALIDGPVAQAAARIEPPTTTEEQT